MFMCVRVCVRVYVWPAAVVASAVAVLRGLCFGRCRAVVSGCCPVLVVSAAVAAVAAAVVLAVDELVVALC